MTVTLGNVIEMAGMAGGGLVFMYRACSRLDRIDERVKALHEASSERRDEIEGVRKSLEDWRNSGHM
jgi:hypothetical protein